MAVEPQAEARASIFVEAIGKQTIAGVNAQICAADGPAPDGPVIWRCGPGHSVPATARVCVADGGLAVAVRLQVGAGAVLVVPRVEVQRTARRYGFSTDNSGSGFSTFHLDPATVAGFDVSDGGRQVSLADWLSEAEQSGFAEVWLHSRDAETSGRGFAGDLLERAHQLAPALGIWLSGGGATRDDIERVAMRPGLVALVVMPQVLASETAEDASFPNPDGAACA